MALKIVHLCDVHSAKGEDIPAQYAHTVTLDGGTYALDLCPTCDAERFIPLVAFLDAFGLLTDGVVDPREAVAENLRQMAGARPGKRKQKSADAPTRVQVRPSSFVPEEPTTPESTPAAPVTSPESVDVLTEKQKLQQHTRERLPLVRSMLLDSPEGLSLREVAARLNTSEGAAGNVLQLLRGSEHAEFIRQKWWAPENVSQETRDELKAMRDVVEARNAVPRICPVEGTETLGSAAWEAHCLDEHGVRPAALLGLVCPMDGQEFSAPQVLGMHGRREHDAVHTPQLFVFAEQAGDPIGLVAGIRKQYGS